MRNLILTICSNHKHLKGQKEKYDAYARKITDLLPDKKKRINDARSQAWEYITQQGRSGRSPAGTPANKNLKCGPDINSGSEERNGLYMPALKRYDGRFYTKFRCAVDNIKDSLQRLNNDSADHLLIVSGLYGLLTPSEPIQDYNCDVPDEPEILRLWTKDALLTKLVISYMHEFGINRVFDFMADDSYRHLIDWKSIEENGYGTIFYPHCHNQIGADMLPELGHVAGLLLSEKPKTKLSDIDFNRPVAGITFSSNEPKWIPAGTTVSERETCAVWAIRMVTNIEKILGLERIPKQKPYSVKDRINRFRLQHNKNKSMSNHMNKVNEFRNNVVHKPNYTFGVEIISEVRERYEKIEGWAIKKGGEYAKLEDVDY